MPEQTIICPYCHREIPLTEAVSHPIREELRREFEEAARLREEQVAAREKEVAERGRRLKDEVERLVGEEKSRLEAAASAKAREALALEMEDLRGQLAEKAAGLEEARAAELELRKRQRELEDQRKNLELAMARRLDEERQAIREQAAREAAEQEHLRLADKDKLIGDLQAKLAAAQRQIEQGSQQAQGEVLEVELEELLAHAFPADEIEPVPTGIRGADLLQRVRDPLGRPCGTIVWESKRTKAWSDAWLEKLREDQRTVKAEAAVIVSIVLPKGLCALGCVGGVWVTERATAVGLGAALRAGLVQTAAARQAAEGQQEKMQLIYRYLTGQEFRHRVEAMVEAFASLRDDLEKEKRAMQKAWAKREKQLERAIMNTAGMFGDLHGIAGASLPEIESLEMKALSPPEGEEEE